MLSIVPTPIGNIDDISVRALQALQRSEVIAAEDPRITQKLLRHFDLHKELLRCPPNREAAAPLVARMLQGQSVALVCDAGTPAIADPGVSLIRAAIERNIEVVALPGPCAALVALVVSGLPPHRFAFDGFPPRGRADRHDFFSGLACERRTIVLYESATYLRSTLETLCSHLGPERPISIARNLTGPKEFVWRGTLQEACRMVSIGRPRGQYTLVLAGLS